MPQSAGPSTRHAVVTCGPGVSPIDEVRRITNFSTGELGVLLAERLARAGWTVTCLKSEVAPFRDPRPPHGGHLCVERFSTNESLVHLLEPIAGAGPVDVVFHAAALNDYEVVRIVTDDGLLPPERKIRSTHAKLLLELAPAPKVLPLLGRIFPGAAVVGWKYELDGDRHTALAQGFEQVRRNGSALCVVNGAALGMGFCLVDGERLLAEAADKEALCEWLTHWVGNRAAEVLPEPLSRSGPKPR